MKVLKKVFVMLLMFAAVSSFVSVNASEITPYWTDVGTVTNNLTITDGTALSLIHI